MLLFNKINYIFISVLLCRLVVLFYICIKDRLPDRHSSLNLYLCVIKLSQPLSLSVCLYMCASVRRLCVYVAGVCVCVCVAVCVCVCVCVCVAGV